MLLVVPAVERRLMLGIDNLTDAAYKSHDSWVYRPGRQLVIATEYRF